MNPAPAVEIPAILERPATPVPFGVQAETGHLRPPLPPVAEENVKTDLREVQARGPGTKVLSLVPTCHGEILSECGWGVLFASDADLAIRTALQCLIDRRTKQVGDTAPLKVYMGAQGVLPGESAPTWLARQGVGLFPVDPDNGVPYHLLIVGSPERIPFDFQYTLDLQWSVGRLDFDTPAEFAAYAQNVVDYETSAAVPQAKQAAMWMPAHGDLATNLLCNDVGLPFFQKPLGQKRGFQQTSLLAGNATKENLLGILSSPPALLFSGSHGLQVDTSSPDFPECQGALICQGWQLGKPVGADVSFSAADIPAGLKLNGMIHFMFACFGAGCPATDTYPEAGTVPSPIAPKPLISHLPQRMLAQGALAVVGHIDRAWSWGFQSGAGVPQSQLLRSVIETIMAGFPAGMAMDFLNGQWGALASQLGLLTGPTSPGAPNPVNLTNLVVARDDARNYILLGDPAARLRVDEMQ